VANIYTNAKADFTDTSNTTVYTSPAATTSIIKSILVSEDSGNADTITVTLTSGASVFNLFKTKAVGSNTTIELLSQPLIMQENEILKAQAATGNRLHMVVSVLQINRD
tara:strand:- start:47 stop:373 length:327 start_codon:yes stop_codon:yes gene_type:complete